MEKSVPPSRWRAGGLHAGRSAASCVQRAQHLSLLYYDPYRIIYCSPVDDLAADPRVPGGPAGARRGRPRSDRAHRAILDAARELLIADGFADLRLEHVAARAGVGKATIYRRWHAKE